MVAPKILDGLEVYLVGGAVRDRLLGLPVKDRDWVVVGSTPTEMESRGFKSVGQEFPVFLHPETKEEYALARTERKTQPGYTGFEFNTSADITLEQDLSRRDLTINAIAQTVDGKIIDPFGGQRDINNQTLRHVSAAFSEDPVRILRVARFRARFGFDIAPETWVLMKTMIDNGEIDALVAERTWLEIRGALTENKPSLFFTTLRDCGALERVLPEIDALFGVPQSAKYHPEIDTGLHTMMVVDQAAALTQEPATRFAALVHDLGKALTPKEELPSHHGHEHSGLQCIRDMCKRLRIPNEYRDLALLGCLTHLKLHRIEELKPSTVLDLLETIDAFRRPKRLQQLLVIGEADARGRKGSEHKSYPQGKILQDYFNAAKAIDIADITRHHNSGSEIGRQVREQRIEAIKNIKIEGTNDDL
ncbi:MAG: multifunctional CCA addition/repair protein [Arenicellales bacterium]|nr:multifunctional CCA addition/repair protein [Arenicellales bacterium]